MLHEQLEHQNVANSIENDRSNTVEMAASSAKMLQLAPKVAISTKILQIRVKLEVRAQECSKYGVNGSFKVKMLQAARKMDRTGNKKHNGKTSQNNSRPKKQTYMYTYNGLFCSISMLIYVLICFIMLCLHVCGTYLVVLWQ